MTSLLLFYPRHATLLSPPCNRSLLHEWLSGAGSGVATAMLMVNT